VNNLIKNDSVICAVKEQVWSDLAGEAVILGLKKGIYYGLNVVGAYIWKLIQEPVLFEKIHESILDNFDIDSEKSRTDLVNILKNMEKQNLIQIDDKISG